MNSYTTYLYCTHWMDWLKQEAGSCWVTSWRWAVDISYMYAENGIHPYLILLPPQIPDHRVLQLNNALQSSLWPWGDILWARCLLYETTHAQCWALCVLWMKRTHAAKYTSSDLSSSTPSGSKGLQGKLLPSISRPMTFESAQSPGGGAVAMCLVSAWPAWSRDDALQRDWDWLNTDLRAPGCHFTWMK